MTGQHNTLLIRPPFGGSIVVFEDRALRNSRHKQLLCHALHHHNRRELDAAIPFFLAAGQAEAHASLNIAVGWRLAPVYRNWVKTRAEIEAKCLTAPPLIVAIGFPIQHGRLRRPETRRNAPPAMTCLLAALAIKSPSRARGGEARAVTAVAATHWGIAPRPRAPPIDEV